MGSRLAANIHLLVTNIGPILSQLYVFNWYQLGLPRLVQYIFFKREPSLWLEETGLLPLCDVKVDVSSLHHSLDKYPLYHYDSSCGALHQAIYIVLFWTHWQLWIVNVINFRLHHVLKKIIFPDLSSEKFQPLPKKNPRYAPVVAQCICTVMQWSCNVHWFIWIQFSMYDAYVQYCPKQIHYSLLIDNSLIH